MKYDLMFTSRVGFSMNLHRNLQGILSVHEMLTFHIHKSMNTKFLWNSVWICNFLMDKNLAVTVQH